MATRRALPVRAGGHAAGAAVCRNKMAVCFVGCGHAAGAAVCRNKMAVCFVGCGHAAGAHG